MMDQEVSHQFLSHHFPTWRLDKTTYMIPPVFHAKGSFQLGTNGDHRGNQGEEIVYNHLQELGRQNSIGMFVIHGFWIWSVERWNQKQPKHRVPDVKLGGERSDDHGECDFIIFHHTLGVIHIEVKNYSSSLREAITGAKDQLDFSEKFIKDFSETPEPLPHWKVIALPSTNKSTFCCSDYPVLAEGNEKILLLFADDIKTTGSFKDWWTRSFESPVLKMSLQNQKGYQNALSNIIMVRHMTSFTESDYILEFSKALSNCTYLEGTACPQIFQSEFPRVSKWCLDVLNTCDKPADAGERELAAYMKGKKLKEPLNRTGLKALNKDLEKSRFLSGGSTPSNLDIALAMLLQDKYLISLKSIVRFLNSIDHMNTHLKIAQKRSERNEVKLHCIRSVNEHERTLTRQYKLVEDDDTPLASNSETFGVLDYSFCVCYSHIPIVFTIEQLVVFEGPKKQLIIGGPGSGKTELLKTKAKQLAVQIKASGENTKILYIVSSSGSTTGNPILGHQMKRFFAKLWPVEVHIIEVDEFHSKLFAGKTNTGLYGHVFVDEYWIGSTPAQHSMFLDFVNRIPGYVWISSINNFQRNLMETDKELASCTKPLVDAIEKRKGTINYLTQIVRGTDSIIDLERDYTALYQDHVYPYGTSKMLGHSVKGLPIAWKCVASISDMYHVCVETIKNIIRSTVPDGCAFIRRQTLGFADVLVVDFAVRIREESPTLKERLVGAGIPVWSHGDSMDDLMNRKASKVTLVSSKTRNDSMSVDGVEWPMVVIILPSKVLSNNDKQLLTDGADILMNYDPYMCFFRAQAKLVVISDKWRSSEEYIEDVKNKPKRRITGDVF